MDALDLDPILLSSELARAAAWYESASLALREDPALTLEWPGFRQLLGRERLDAVRARPDQDPMKLPLLRWLYFLTERRINQAWYNRAAWLATGEKHAVSEPSRATLSLSEMLHEALRHPSARDAWLTRLAEHAGESSRASSVHGQRRRELQSRLKLDADAFELPSPDVVASASRWLASTRDLADAFSVRTLGERIARSLGDEVRLAFPSRLGSRALAEWFREGSLLDSLEPQVDTWPEPLGASSYGRALWNLGHAFRRAAASDRQPFVVAHDPLGLEAHATGALFASLLDCPQFLMRRLGASRSGARDTCRVMARLWLFESRWLALAVVLRPLSMGPREALEKRFGEMTHDVLGFDLPVNLALVVPRLRPDAPQRFVGLALGRARADALEEAHDEDWFRNPRATDELRSEAALSPETQVETQLLDQRLDELRRQLTRALGA